MPETIIKKLTMHQKDANGNDIIMRPQTESSQIVDFNVAVNNLISQSQSGGNTNLTADDITAMIGYSKPNSTSNISTSDTLNQAIGKLEKALDGKQASGSYLTTTGTAADSSKLGGTAASTYALKADIPTNISDFNNDSGYITGVEWDDVTNKPLSFTPSSHNQASNTINAMTGYSKPSSTSAISTSDTLNQAIGKLEKALESVDTDTKVTNTLSNSTKFYVTGTSSSSTNTGTQYFDNGIYVTAESGKLHATSIETEGNLVIGGTADTNYIQLPSGIKLY